MKFSKLTPFLVSPWVAFAAQAEPLLVSDIFEQAKAETLLRIAMPVHSDGAGQISFEVEHRDDSRTMDEIYTFSVSDIEADDPATHIVLDTRSNTAWTYDEAGSFRGVYSVAIDPQTVYFFEGGRRVIEYPLTATIDAVMLPFDTEPSVDLPPEAETFAALGNGIFKNGFGDIPAGATLGPSGSNIITTENGRLFVWRPFPNATQLYVWEIINNSESLGGQIVDLDEFVSAVTLGAE